MITKSYMLWAILSVSGVLLVITLFRHKYGFSWIGYICLNVAFAAFLLYGINLLGAYTRLELPINPATVGAVSMLGIPGLLLLISLKLWIV